MGKAALSGRGIFCSRAWAIRPKHPISGLPMREGVYSRNDPKVIAQRSPMSLKKKTGTDLSQALQIQVFLDNPPGNE